MLGQEKAPPFESNFLGTPTPNPTFSNFTIQIGTGNPQLSRLVLLNSLGYEVMDLTKELRLIQGIGTVEIQTRDLLPDVYQICLSAENFKEHRKLIILK